METCLNMRVKSLSLAFFFFLFVAFLSPDPSALHRKEMLRENGEEIYESDRKLDKIKGVGGQRGQRGKMHYKYRWGQKEVSTC